MPEVVERLATVELAPDTAAERFVGEPPQRVSGPDQFSVLEERSGQGVLLAAGLEAGEEQSSGDVASFERPCDAQEIVPLPVDHVDHVDLGVVASSGAGMRPVPVAVYRVGSPQRFLAEFRDSGR